MKELGLITRECACVGADIQKIFDAYWYLAQSNVKIPKMWPDGFNTIFNKGTVDVKYNAAMPSWHVDMLLPKIIFDLLKF